MNNKGQLIITDILLYLIILTLLLGIIVHATTTLNDNQVSRINTKELNNILENNFEMLTKTTGNPHDWEQYHYKDIKTIGLKTQNSQLLSYTKLSKLKNNKELLDKYFPTDYSLILYPKNNVNNKELIAGKEYLTTNKQIQSKSTEVVFDYDYTITSFAKDNQSTCPYNHDNQWICKAFNINKTLLKQGKYYIITDSSTEYILSNTYSNNISGQTHDKININNQLEQLMTTENQTIYLHTRSNTDNTYMVYDTNNREEFLETIIKPEVYILNLKVST